VELVRIQVSWDLRLCRYMRSSRRFQGSYVRVKPAKKIFYFSRLTREMKALPSKGRKPLSQTQRGIPEQLRPSLKEIPSVR
jgi:hypothetical protein